MSEPQSPIPPEPLRPEAADGAERNADGEANDPADRVADTRTDREAKDEAERWPGDDYTLDPRQPPPKYPRELDELQRQVEQRLNEESQPDRESRQFTLTELFLLTTLVAVVLGLMGTFSPPAFAFFFGLAVFVALVIVSIVAPEKPIVMIGWWAMFAVYLLACIAALVRQ